MSDSNIVELKSKRPADWFDTMLEGIREQGPESMVIVFVTKDDPNSPVSRISLGANDHGLGMLWALEECRDDLRQILRSDEDDG